MGNIFFKLLFTSCSLAVSSILPAQVTIGSDNAPAKGALLQLTEGVITAKGLGLPRVKLTQLKPATDAELAQSIGNMTADYGMDEHIGLVIYNSNNDPVGCVVGKDTYQYIPAQGLYVWDGEKWQQLSNLPEVAEDVRTVTDHGTTVVEGIAVGSFTMSCNDGTNPAENETYYYADYGIAGTWMTQNLRTQYNPDGTKLIMTGNQSIDGKDASGSPQKVGGYPSRTDPTNPADYNDNRASGKEIGLLYDWYTATDHRNCSTSDQAQVGFLSDNPAIPGANEVESKEPQGYIKGICPIGWHLPSDREWNRLEKYLTQKASTYTQAPPTANGIWTDSWESTTGSRGTINGTVMKSKTAVNNPGSILSLANSKTAQNGGFDVFLEGYAISGSSRFYGTSKAFWSSSSRLLGEALHRSLDYREARVYRLPIPRNYLVSVRCKKN